MATKATTPELVKGYQQTIFYAAKQTGLTDDQARIIVAQAQHESGNFTSPLFQSDNNLFGMKMPSKRDKTFIAGPSARIRKSEGSTPYASYKNVSDSTKDLILSWHKAINTDWSKIQTPEQYAAYLKSKGYYGDTLANYTNALKSNFAKLKNVTFILLPFAALFFFNPNYFIRKSKN